MKNNLKNITLRAYAKINLFLDITGKRPDGYHELKTVMQSVDIFDELEFTVSEGEGIMISTDRVDLPCDEHNLVYKGIKAVFDYLSFTPCCRIDVKLKKNIPSGAGMGGGSADCAAAIIAVNELFDFKLNSEQMRTIGTKCGADVPFCIEGGTALCEGIGEKITRLKYFDNAIIAVCKPEESISTPAAYKCFDESGNENAGDYRSFEKALSLGSAQTGKVLYNAFTKVCSLKQVNDAIQVFIDNGAYGSEMTGSGSAVFAIFPERNSAEKALNKLDMNFRQICSPIPVGVEIIKKG